MGLSGSRASCGCGKNSASSGFSSARIWKSSDQKPRDRRQKAADSELLCCVAIGTNTVIALLLRRGVCPIFAVGRKIS